MFRSFRCASCRVELFDESALGVHVQTRECRSWFVEEPLSWMVCKGASGKVCCPKCERKIGNFDWCGIRCSCGEWIAPGFQIGAKSVDAKSIKPRKACVSVKVSLHWLETAPPPCVVVVSGGNEARELIEGRWFGRHLREGRAAWIYPSREDDIDDVIDAVANRGVPPSNVAVGAVGRFLPSKKARIAFALSIPPDDDSIIDALVDACRQQNILAVFVDRVPPRLASFPISARAFGRLDSGELSAGVVRTLVHWLHDHLPGHGPPS